MAYRISFFLYARDLKYSGYHLADLFRVYAFNLLLIPINLGGVFKSLQQAITGDRTPFARTPKVTGRTSAPALYVFAEYGRSYGGWRRRFSPSWTRTGAAPALALQTQLR